MFYFLLSLVINLFILYTVYQKLIIKMNEPEKKEKAEMNSLILEFNKITKNNIDLLEDKINELKSIIQLADEKIELRENRKDLEKKINSPLRMVDNNPVEYNRINKTEIMEKYIQEGKSSKEIAKLMGINTAEVELYQNLKRKRR